VGTAAFGAPATRTEPQGLKSPIFLSASTRPSKGRSSTYTARVDSEIKTGTVLREITTHSAEETIAFGRTLTELLSPPKLVLLRGDLGAGKTTLVKGIAAAFDAASEEDVTSPTFTLIHEYRGPRANLFHVDLYRIDTPRELDTLALDDLRGDNSILLIEWGEKFPRLVRERDVEIALEREGENGRRIRVSA
jgi:tRNA threonylcarbamoyladenosine biosynthesis protein TsaE